MSAVSLAPRALYQEVAELLRQRIFRRELEPGSWIDEMKLAEEYGISRTPLREALKVLAAEGLVTMKVRRGAYVTEVSDKRPDRRLPPARRCWKATPPAWWPSAPPTPQLQELQALHEELEAAADEPRPVLRDQRTLPHAPAGDRRQPLAQPDGGRPAQGDEAQPPQLAAEVRAHRGVAARASRHHARRWRRRDAKATVEKMQAHFRQRAGSGRPEPGAAPSSGAHQARIEYTKQQAFHAH